MPSRLIAVALVAGFLSTAADAATWAKHLAEDRRPGAGLAIEIAVPTPAVALRGDRPEGMTRPEFPELDQNSASLEGDPSSHPSKDTALSYSYLPAESSKLATLSLSPLVLVKWRLFERAVGGHAAEPAGTTYTIVDDTRLRRRPGQLPTAVIAFTSALCGLGGLAWWRRHHRSSC
jgi:hypothetical protein